MAYTQLYYPPTTNGLQKTLDAQLDEGHTTAMTLSNVTGVQDKPGVVVINRIDADSAELSAAVREYVIFTGVSGSTLTGLTRGVGGTTDQDHAVGSVVEFIPDITVFQALIDAFLVEHNEADATHKTALVAMLAGAQTFTGAKTFGAGLLKATSPQITTGINDSSGNELIKVTATGSAVNELTLANAATGNNVTLSVTGGDTNAGLDLKMKGTGKYRKPSVLQIPCFAAGTSTATGDGKAFFEVPEELNGMNLTGCGAFVYTAGTTNTTDVQIRNVTDSQDMLSTKITIDSGETSSRTAATAAVINASYDDVATGDRIAIDVDAVSTTAAKGLVVWLRFELPA